VPVSPLGPVIAAALLPGERMRQAYRLRWGWREQAFRLAAGTVARLAPPLVSEWPHARVARQRSAAPAAKAAAPLGWRDPAAGNRKRGAGHYHQRAAAPAPGAQPPSG